MDNNEAIRRIEDHMRVHKLQEPHHAIKITEALKKAIEALHTNIAIPIINVPSKVSGYLYSGEYRCPKCNELFRELDNRVVPCIGGIGLYNGLCLGMNPYCSECGQHILWVGWENNYRSLEDDEEEVI